MRILIGTIIVVAAAACSDTTKPRATLPTITDTVEFYTLNQSPAGAPNAVALHQGAALRADANFGFDLAFDIDGSGNAVILPVRQVSGFGQGYRVGLQLRTESFEALTEAPRGGYKHDSTLVVPAGAVVAVESADPSACGLSYFSNIFYSKLRILTVDPVRRRVRAAFTVDRNCGYRSFAEGLPKD